MQNGLTFQLIEFVWRPIPFVGISKGLPSDRDYGPNLCQYRIQIDKFPLIGRHITFGEDGLRGAFRYAKRAIDTLVRVNRQKVVALVEAINGADHHAIRVFALDAVLRNNKGHIRDLVVGLHI